MFVVVPLLLGARHIYQSILEYFCSGAALATSLTVDSSFSPIEIHTQEAEQLIEPEQLVLRCLNTRNPRPALPMILEQRAVYLIQFHLIVPSLGVAGCRLSSFCAGPKAAMLSTR